jgi:hypothetical protein
MQRNHVLVLVSALVLIAGGALFASQTLGDDDTPIGRWSAGDELEVPNETGDALTVNDANAPTMERSAVEAGGRADADDRVEVVLRGRVVDKFHAPVASATVWLDFARGGPRGGGPGNRQRRVPDPVVTDAEGRFAFQGSTFRNLRVSLQVAHQRHAPGLFDKDIGPVVAAVDLGDLVLMAGGEVRGRVTDLDGNGVAAAEVRLQPENGNRAGQLRDRDRMLPPVTTDQNGFYRRPHVGAGEWTVAVTAKRHTEGRSSTFAVEEEQVADVDDVRLGPGYEITGYVRDERGGPIAKASVALRSEGRGGNGRAGGDGNGPGAGWQAGWQGQGGREHRATTDAEGRFFLEHLPGAPMRIDVVADGFLDYRQAGVDATVGQPLHIAMQDGLRIEGKVHSGGTPVTQFAFRAVRVRGLTPPGLQNLDVQNIMAQLRDGNLDPATRDQLRAQMESLRQVEGMRMPNRGEGARGGRNGRSAPAGAGEDERDRGGPAGRVRDLGKPEQHPGGTFVAAGLQEGVYEVHVQSPDHARQRSTEVEVRNGAGPAQLTIELDDGVFVAGVVVDTSGRPLRGARVELRQPSAFEDLGRMRGGRGGNGNANGGNGGFDFNGMAREFARSSAGAQLTLETTTNAEGGFVLKHVPRGTWRLHAEAKGHADRTTDSFELAADRSGVELRLGGLGSIAGVVQGLRANETENVRVAVMPFTNPNGSEGQLFGAMFRGGRGGGLAQNVGVAADGSYRIDDLEPGEYVVRSWVGSMQDFLREMAPRLDDGSLRADVTVAAGAATKYDPLVVRPRLGTVAGTIQHNGAPATGFQVELSRQDDGGAPRGDNGPGRGRGPGGGPGFGRTFQATVASSGAFAIQNVPAGIYRLRVQASRRGGTLHEEVVDVVADGRIERSLHLETAALEGSVTAEPGADPRMLGGRVTLLPGLTAMPADYDAYVRDNPRFDAPARDGRFRFDAVRPGGYLLVFSAAGRERTSASVVVQGNQTVTIQAGKPRTAPAETEGNQPRGRNGGNGGNGAATPNGNGPRRGQQRGR